MDAARWELIEAIVADLAELPAAARPAELERRCGDDPDLRHAVEQLLLHAGGDTSFLDHPVVDPGAIEAALTQTSAPEVPGYRILRVLDRGGMGEVWLAEREVAGVPQEVALKVIRPGMATDEVLRRFHLERRILATLHHPHIAQLLDGGRTADGRPFFAMEYVEGEPIDRWCDAQALPVTARLALFRTVCAAVQHAHQSLVLHRDIKPGNILVRDDGTPTLLDFGIGKLLVGDPADPATPATRTEVRLLTPEYAAPEQLTGAPVTTATDVYALGVLLYELLTGRHPHGAGPDISRQMIERAVLASDPTRPGAVDLTDEIARRRGTSPTELRRRLSGDLGTIVLMALRREPGRRYASAAALAEDLDRYQRRLPIRARPDTMGYRSRQFLRRHAAAVMVGAAILAALVATTGVTLLQSRRVATEAALVAVERDKAIEVRGFLMEMFGATGGNRSVGDTLTVRGLLDRQAAVVEDNYRDRPEVLADMLDALADGYDRLGLHAEADPLARRALTLRREVLGDRHPDVARSLNAVGWIASEQGRTAEAEPLLREAVAIHRASGSRQRLDLSRALNDLGVVLTRLEKLAPAESVLTEALTIRRAAWGDAHRSIGITANNLAAVFFQQGRWAEAATTMEVAVEALTRTVGPDHQRTIIALSNLAVLRREAGLPVAAESTYRDLLARQERMQGADHPLTASVRSTLGLLVGERAIRTGRGDLLNESARLLRQALASQETSLGATHPQVGRTLDGLVPVLLEQGRMDEALTTARRAVELWAGAFGEADRRTADGWTQLAMVHARRGNLAEAIRLSDRAVPVLTEAAGANHPQTALAALQSCEFLLAAGDRPGDARTRCAHAANALPKAPVRYQVHLARARLWLAMALAAGRDLAGADSVLALIRADSASVLSPRDRRRLDSLAVAVSAR